MRYFFCFISLLLLFGCTRKANSSKKMHVGLSPFSLVEKQIVELEDTLHISYQKLMNNTVDTLPVHTIHLLESRYKRAFQLDPKHPRVGLYLDKLQQLFMQEKKYALSISWTDTLLTYFPVYEQKAALLLNAATTADIYLKNEQKMRYYYQRLLSEHPKLKKEILEMVQLRLQKS